MQPKAACGLSFLTLVIGGGAAFLIIVLTGGLPEECGAGAYSAAKGNLECAQCPAGTANPLEKQDTPDACTVCAPGTWSAKGSPTCELCPLGTWNDRTGMDGCELCPAGRYSNGTGSAVCTLCPAGTELPTEGGTAIDDCTPCGLGFFSPEDGTTNCLACLPGSYSDTTGATECTLCAAGTFNPDYEATSAAACQDCSTIDVNYDSLEGAAQCTDGTPADDDPSPGGDEPKDQVFNCLEGRILCMGPWMTALFGLFLGALVAGAVIGVSCLVMQPKPDKIDDGESDDEAAALKDDRKTRPMTSSPFPDAKPIGGGNDDKSSDGSRGSSSRRSASPPKRAATPPRDPSPEPVPEPEPTKPEPVVDGDAAGLSPGCDSGSQPGARGKSPRARTRRAKRSPSTPPAGGSSGSLVASRTPSKGRKRRSKKLGGADQA